MDFAVALASAAQALNIVKQLREIDKNVSEGELKSAMADLYGKLADLKIALSDARETIHEKDRQIKELGDRIAALTSGEACPICNVGRMKVASSREHPHFGFAGVQERIIKCDHCTHSENRMYDPSGVTKKK
jgi:chromosome segregation ATPase